AESRLKHVFDALTDRIGSTDEALAPDRGLLQYERIVEQGERLSRNVGDVAATLRHLAAGKVERTEKLRTFHQVVLDVHATPPLSVERTREETSVGVFARAERLNARAEQRAVQSAGRGQNRVAYHLRFHASGRIVLKKPVLRIDLARGGRG